MIINQDEDIKMFFAGLFSFDSLYRGLIFIDIEFLTTAML